MCLETWSHGSAKVSSESGIILGELIMQGAFKSENRMNKLSWVRNQGTRDRNI